MFSRRGVDYCNTLIAKTQAEMMCDGTDDSKLVNGTCIKCVDCPLGQGRNLTSEVPRDKHGNQRCRQCNACPSDTFDVNFNNECQKCDFDKCHRYHRKVHAECGRLQDLQCGSCLSGYYDEYESIDFPCSPEVSSKKTQPKIQNKNESLVHEQIHQHNPTNGLQALPDKNDIDSILVISSSVTLAVLVSVLIILLYKRLARQRQRRKLAGILSSVAVTHRLLNDVETDGPTHPRGELAPMPYIRDPRPELTTGDHAPSGPRGLVHKGYFIPEDARRSILEKGVCKCKLSLNTPCDVCKRYVEYFKEVNIRKGDPIVTIISTNVCHESKYLLHCLNVPDPDHYQIDNDRQRNIRNMSQSECVHQILNRLLEKEKEVDLLNVLNALCYNHFHGINTKIKEYLDNKANRDNTFDDDTHSIASMV